MPEFHEYEPNLERQQRIINKVHTALNDEIVLAKAAGDHPASCAEDSMRALAMAVAAAITTQCDDMLTVLQVAQGFGLVMAQHFEKMATMPEGSSRQ